MDGETCRATGADDGDVARGLDGNADGKGGGVDKEVAPTASTTDATPALTHADTTSTSPTRTTPTADTTPTTTPTDEGEGGEEHRRPRPRKHEERGPLNLSTIPLHVTQTLHVCSNHKKPQKLLATLAKIRRRDREAQNHDRNRGSLTLIFFNRIKTLHSVSSLLLPVPVDEGPERGSGCCTGRWTRRNATRRWRGFDWGGLRLCWRRTSRRGGCTWRG